MTALPRVSYRRHRFSPEVISHCVWLYFRFQLSFRDVEEMMAAQGIYLRIAGRIQYLWCTVDQDGQVIDVLVQPRRNAQAATRFLKKLLRKAGAPPRLVVTDKLASYIKPCSAALPLTQHIRDKGQNNRAENSHQPTRQRERRMRGFKSAAQAQRFLSIFSEISNLFAFSRHTVSATNFRVLLTRRLAAWRALTLPDGLT